MKQVTIYTDGACSGNPGPGGWGAVLSFRGIEKELSAYDPYTTNQKMELTAALMALETLKEECEVDLYSDSAYLFNGFTKGWIASWKKNGWKNSKKEEVANKELWQGLDAQNQRHQIHWHKVKGHSDNQGNNRCDKLATDEIKKHKA